MNLILIGPQGSGKGTQAELLIQKLKIPAVSVGQLLREQIKEKTKLGKEVKVFVLKGELVPNQITNQLIREELRKEKYKKGVILDGYPRHLEQATFLEKLIKIDCLIVIEISEAETIKRLSGRRVCECGETYHLEYKKPKNDMVCDKDNKPLIQRKDDYPEAIKERLNIYHTETQPVIDYFQKQDKVIKIDGEASIGEVFERIYKALKDKGLKNDNL